MRDDAMLFLFACSCASNILGTIVEHNMCKSSIPWCYCRIYLNTQLYVQLDQRFVKWCRLDSVPALGTIWCRIIFTTLYSIINESPEHWIGEHVRPSYAYCLVVIIVRSIKSVFSASVLSSYDLSFGTCYFDAVITSRPRTWAYRVFVLFQMEHSTALRSLILWG